jgi:pimeloyl-ACP methyl ester carboxylesterase
MAATLRGMAMRAASDDIAEDLDVPALVIAGGCDRVLPTSEARAVAANFPRAQLIECTRSGHLPMLEEPQRVTDAIGSWLHL